jgi:L-ascorbate metabolism protein UlaG (beta-lactamase superfamily)
VRVLLARHATLLVELGSRRLLVDPLLSEPGALPPVEGTPEPRPNPLVRLGLPREELLRDLDGLVVTHLHSDHLDEAALAVLPRELPVFCQPADAGSLAAHGFTQVRPVDVRVRWDGLNVVRTAGEHGVGALGRRMGPVAGFVFAAPEEPILYVAGDTVWCPAVEEALALHHPDVVVVNAGAARFLEGDPITMGAADVARTARAAPQARVAAVHMEAVNHCLLTRAELRAELVRQGVAGRVEVPEDGAGLTIP